MSDGVALSVVVVTYRRPELLAPCLASAQAALAEVPEPSELVVVDNGSGDRTSALVAQDFPASQLQIIPENVGFTGAVARGLGACRGEWVATLNDDTTVDRGAFAALLAAARSAPGVGAVAAQMRFAGQRNLLNSAGIEIDRLGVGTDRLLGLPIAASETEWVEVFGVSAGAALYRRAMLDELGGFDQSFFAYLEDVDLAWRARMHGWRALYAPSAVIHHHHSATLRHKSSLKYRLVGRNRVRMLAKNATTRQLARHCAAIVTYDLAYVAYVGMTDRTLAPLRGRLEGLREWRRYRRLGTSSRRAVALCKSRGLRGALQRDRAWTSGKGTSGA